MNDDPTFTRVAAVMNSLGKHPPIEPTITDDERAAIELLAYQCEGNIYVILDDEADAVKIGFGKDVTARLHGLQSGNPRDLELLISRPGNRRDERRLHKQFARHRIRGEWFHYHDDIDEFICDLEDLSLLAIGQMVKGNVGALYSELVDMIPVTFLFEGIPAPQS